MDVLKQRIEQEQHWLNVNIALLEIKTEDLTDETMEFLYEMFMDEMPYGTQKARDGDPYDWIISNLDYIQSELERMKHEINHQRRP